MNPQTDDSGKTAYIMRSKLLSTACFSLIGAALAVGAWFIGVKTGIGHEAVRYVSICLAIVVCIDVAWRAKQAQIAHRLDLKIERIFREHKEKSEELEAQITARSKALREASEEK